MSKTAKTGGSNTTLRGRPADNKHTDEPAPTRKPPGYWDDFTHVEAAIRSFIAEQGQEGIMPSSQDLQTHGKPYLARVMLRHGGFRKIAQRLGLDYRSQRWPNAYWDNFDNLRDELVAFAAQHGQNGVMPSLRDLEHAGRLDLVGAVQRHGTVKEIATRAGLAYWPSQKPTGYWTQPARLDAEIKRFIAERGDRARMPTRRELLQADRWDLVGAITRQGGSHVVATRLGLSGSGKSKTK